MKRNFRLLSAAGIAALLALPAAAGEPTENWHLGLDVSLANDSLRKVTEKTEGLGLCIGLDRKLGDSNVGFRPGFSMHFLPGNYRGDDSKVSLTNLQLAMDLLIPTGLKNLNVATGLSLNLWRYSAIGSNQGVPPYDLSGSKAPNDLKFGFRLGLDAKVSSNVTAEVMLQMVEFGRYITGKDYIADCINPSWVQVGARYHF